MMSSPVEQSPPRLLTPGIQEQTPAYFCRLLWHYIDALPMEGVAVSHELHFFIRQEACHCRLACVQDGPRYHHRWDMQLFSATDLLPTEIIVYTVGERQIMCLPEELPALQAHYGD
ncbi:DUF960 family protein [Schleiferilactobacillus harbinensis]|jgi:hypothetical protein|uniref:DUF960 family protein n=1 Tax=Schleiferilactobacillus harbinensis TaxID=304207 RepID=A0A510TYG1_9LACO|nr:DUF960 family protein [Schleiferilactobacillus harbinensis]HAY53789.1 hypothetical protein [Lactobacillus sp.]MCI1688639.1 DUF960 family protein [Schleiferilactobacillus harbinensis]MCI1783233.1 DUF960 family protein [Schleiferilactobacillus harbinensis]MCI1849847.1 DUF960 family protein [Schleiferilactobacillus harbinensis]MCT2908995.1 hypothetical protein [Schleiferilactobacillus harbinensis]